jgi:pyruvate/2-oxoglutarate dehydrogenase complex dihydrolipoamide acyltransferase (E2) component
MTTTDMPAWPASLPPMPVVDFAQFGAVEAVPLSRHQKTAGSVLARNWAQIPHVTHHDEAEIDAAEALRQRLADPQGDKPSLLPLLIKATVRALRALPRFNASLVGDTLVLKRYFHIGVAVDTPAGQREALGQEGRRGGCVHGVLDALSLRRPSGRARAVATARQKRAASAPLTTRWS